MERLHSVGVVLTGEETIASCCFIYLFVGICFSFISFIFSVVFVEIIFVAIEVVWQLIAAGRLRLR